MRNSKNRNSAWKLELLKHDEQHLHLHIPKELGSCSLPIDPLHPQLEHFETPFSAVGLVVAISCFLDRYVSQMNIPGHSCQSNITSFEVMLTHSSQSHTT